MPTLSVIICAYNAAETLKRAAKSVLCQGFRDFELIIVNDGSTDATLAEISALAMTDSRVKAVNVPNGGVAKARNISLGYAKGDYITFCDADDYMDDGALAAMYEAAEQNGSDMVITGYFHETVLKNGISRVEISAKDAVYTSKQEIYRDLVELKSKYLVDAMCNKLFRRSVITENGLKFPEGELFEDTAFNLKFLELAPRLTMLDRCFYHYIQHRKSGITRKYNPKKAEFLLSRYHLLLSFCDGAGESVKGYCHIYHIRNMYSFISGTYEDKEMSAKERSAVVCEIISSEDFKTCIKNATAHSTADKVSLFVAKLNSVFFTKMYCKAIFLAKTKAAVLFTKFKR